MTNVSRGIACRVCKHINDKGECEVKQGSPVNNKDDCWRYENKNNRSGLVEHSHVDLFWKL